MLGSLRRLYDFGHLRADCRGPGSAPESYACFEYGTTLTDLLVLTRDECNDVNFFRCFLPLAGDLS